MPIDLNLLRVERGGDPEIVRASEKTRGRDGTVVDQVISHDAEWRRQIYQMENLKKELNSVNKEIGQRKKVDRSDDCADAVAKTTALKQAVAKAEAAARETETFRDTLVNKIGNLVHPSVVKSNDEANNQVIHTYGKIDTALVADGTPGRLRHHEIMQRLKMVDLRKGVELAGHRGYFLKGVGVMLNMALINYGLSFLRRRKYTDVQPPFFMRREVMQETAELGDFAETLYKIPMNEGKDTRSEKDDLFLIATSEQPISALHRGEFVDPKGLPYRYAGVSTCFRKEAGAHGKDMWGIFRVHQFEKVEQFVITTPEESEAMHEEMIHLAEEFYQTLELPYRVVSIVAGALNDAASKKYDLEAWFPGYNDYRELVSCSNCLDYQARALEIRCGHPKQSDREKRYVHMLNATLVATQRAMCCILENYQTRDGVRVPRVLVPYMDGMEFLRFPSSDSAAANES